MWSQPIGVDRTARVVVTDRRHGDLAVTQPPDVLDRRRRAVVDAPWTWLHQVHGADVVVVARAGDGAGAEADALCTTEADVPLAVQVADCAPVAFIADEGVVGVAHAGWRGLAAGVVANTVAAMRELGAGRMVAVLGPCIHPHAYEFGPVELDALEERFGPTVRSRTSAGTPALDVPATVAAALDEIGVPLADRLGGCTATEADLRWSHRARGERERQAMVVWMETP